MSLFVPEELGMSCGQKFFPLFLGALLITAFCGILYASVGGRLRPIEKTFCNQLQHIDFALNTSLPNGNDLDNLASNKIVRSRTRRFTSFSGGRRDLPLRHPALETGIMTSQRLPHAHPDVNSVYMGRENAASSARIRGKDRPL